MKKLGIALLAISMCFACGDAEQEREALAENEFENLEDAYERDNATLDALDRCDVAAATVYNDDELLACESAFESCSNVEIQRLTNKLECEAGFTDNCGDEESMAISPECAEGYASIAPPNNGAWTDFQAWASGTNWCGSGTDIASTVCPTSDNSSDFNADKQCRRHDHGKVHESAGVGVRLECMVDRNLSDNSSNWAVQGAFGNWGIAQTWGCMDKGSYNCWNWKSKWWGGYWRYGNYCNGQHNEYGPWRYYWATSQPNNHIWGYKAKEIECDSDVW